MSPHAARIAPRSGGFRSAASTAAATTTTAAATTTTTAARGRARPYGTAATSLGRRAGGAALWRAATARCGTNGCTAAWPSRSGANGRAGATSRTNHAGSAVTRRVRSVVVPARHASNLRRATGSVADVPRRRIRQAPDAYWHHVDPDQHPPAVRVPRLVPVAVVVAPVGAVAVEDRIGVVGHHPNTWRDGDERGGADRVRGPRADDAARESE
jgi:hypothetical protein